MTGQAAIIWAESALTPAGWQQNISVEIAADGKIKTVTANSEPEQGAMRVGVLLPAPVNLHSHSFQRAMAGLSEAKSPQQQQRQDSFWTWRQIMFAFLDHLTPEDIEAITAFVQMEMLEAGYAAQVEFHYLHHQPGGRPYDNLAEMSARIASAADQSGIGLTHLPVYYEFGGCDRRALSPGQIRFGNNFDRFARLIELAEHALAPLPADASLGLAPHSLRAVDPHGLFQIITLRPNAPLHMHICEQLGEVDEVTKYLGARPLTWLFNEHQIDERWCLIHCTHMTQEETSKLAASGAVAGLCPLTESSLGDGIFNGVEYLSQSGRFGIGSDSNIRISLSEELRTLEYSQRLKHKGRAMMATHEHSTGRVLYEHALAGGAQAAGRASGALKPGLWADLIALDKNSVNTLSKTGDTLLDSYIFAGDDRLVTDVWSAGRHLVQSGQHIRRDNIEINYKRTLKSLMERL